MQIAIEVPGDIFQHPHPPRRAVEVIAIAAYRSGGWTAEQAVKFLSLSSTQEFEVLLLTC
jgi:hypothetical protein